MSNFGEDLDEIFGWLGRKNRFLWQARKNWKEVFQDSAQPRDLGEARGLSSGGLRRSLKGLDGLGPEIRQRIDILVIGGVPRLSGANKGREEGPSLTSKLSATCQNYRTRSHNLRECLILDSIFFHPMRPHILSAKG